MNLDFYNEELNALNECQQGHLCTDIFRHGFEELLSNQKLEVEIVPLALGDYLCWPRSYVK